MAGIRHRHTATGADDPEAEVNAAQWNDTHIIDTLDLVGQTSDPVSPADGQAWYRSDLGLWRICSGGRVSDLAPVGQEVALSADVTLTAADNGKTYTLTANRTITLPTAPVVGYAVSVSCNTTSTATLIAPGATVDRDLFVYPTEWALFIWTGARWTRIMRRGFGINNAGAMGLLSDLRSTVHPSGLWIVNSTTANISARPSHMDTSAVVRIERRDASQLSMTMWSLTHGQGSWRATYAAGTWSAWSNGGSIAALPTASLPTNVATGAEVFDTDRDRIVVWDGALAAWIDASDRARHTGTQLAATISDFATAADARVAAGITGKADLAHTHAFADLTAKPTDRAGYGITDVTGMLPVIPATSGTWAHLGDGRGAVGARAETAGVMRLRPYIARATGSITSVAVGVNTAVASSLAKVAFYEAGTDGRPTTLIAESADIDCSATGVRTASIAPVAQVAGQQYWVGVRVSANQSLNTDANSSRIDGLSAASTAGPTVVSRTITYATGAPTTWGYTNSEVTANRDPWFCMGQFA